MVAKKTTPRLETLIADNYRNGLSIRKIASAIDLSTDTVRQVLIKAGVQRRPVRRPHIYSCHDAKIKELYLDGLSTRDIGHQMGLTQATVHRYLIRMKVPLRGQPYSHRVR